MKEIPVYGIGWFFRSSSFIQGIKIAGEPEDILQKRDHVLCGRQNKGMERREFQKERIKAGDPCTVGMFFFFNQLCRRDAQFFCQFFQRVCPRRRCALYIPVKLSMEYSVLLQILKFNPLLFSSLFNVAKIFLLISKIATSLRPPFRQRQKESKPYPKYKPACLLPELNCALMRPAISRSVYRSDLHHPAVILAFCRQFWSPLRIHTRYRYGSNPFSFAVSIRL